MHRPKFLEKRATFDVCPIARNLADEHFDRVGVRLGRRFFCGRRRRCRWRRRRRSRRWLRLFGA